MAKKWPNFGNWPKNGQKIFLMAKQSGASEGFSKTFQITKTFHVAMLQRYRGFWDSAVSLDHSVLTRLCYITAGPKIPAPQIGHYLQFNTYALY